jgi:hypothetical protein
MRTEGPGECFAARDTVGFVRPGVRYTARVEAAGRVLTGSTTVPAAFTLVEPVAAATTARTECRLPARTAVELVWRPSAGATAYVAELSVGGLAGLVDAYVPEDPLRLLGLAVSEADTTMMLPAEFGLFDVPRVSVELLLALRDGFPEGDVSGDVVVAAVDRNFTNWARGGAFNPSGLTRTPSLHGDGTGVFGSLVRRGFRFTVVDSAGAPGVSCDPAPDATSASVERR